MSNIKAKSLKKGDIIAVIAPSRYVGDFGVSLEKGISLLKEMGFIVKIGKYLHGKNLNSAGTVIERLSDVNDAINDKNVKAIFCALGGDSSNEIIEYIDYEGLRKNPKIIMGFSDITHILLAIQKETSLVTIYGPNVKDIGAASVDGLDALKNFLIGNQEMVKYENDLEVIKHGKVEGELIGGNLFVVNALMSSRYSPSLDGKIIFIEDIDEGISTIRFQLQQMKLSGSFSKIAGMVVGHIVRDEESLVDSALKELLLEVTKDFSFPIIHVEYFGHGLETFYPLPIGVRALIDTESKGFSLLEETFLK